MSQGAHCSPSNSEHKRPQLEVADIFRSHGDAYRRTHRLSREQRKAMCAIERCRTAELGGHVDICDHCGHRRPAYNSCRNRHCPKCQCLAQAKWIAARKARVLPVAHFHVVFTLPSALRQLARTNRREVFGLLFRASADTLLAFGADPQHLGGQLGITSVLHTWTRSLEFHPHVHCVVTAGGLSPDGTRWLRPRGGEDFLFPVHALSKVFRGKFLDALVRSRAAGALCFADTGAAFADDDAFGRLIDRLRRRRWVVYAKRPFGGAEHVFEYLGRYTHRVGLSNQRLVGFDEAGVQFVTRGDQTTTLSPEVFIARFLEHVLPAGFAKIRHYGLHASGNVKTRLATARELVETEAQAEPETEPDGRPLPPDEADRCPWLSLDWRDHFKELSGVDLRRCPRCSVGTMIRHPLSDLEPQGSARAPPIEAPR